MSSNADSGCDLRAALDGTVLCWGYNGNGGLGDGTTTSRTVPAPVAGFSGAVSVSVGANHACALREDGTIACWGYNGTGAIGDGTTTQRLTPVAVTGVTGATGVAAGYRSTCATLGDGSDLVLGVEHARRARQPDHAPVNSAVAAVGFPCGAGTSQTCNGCVPTTCAAQGTTSGVIADGCGGTLLCGTTTPARVSSGSNFSCAIEPGGTARCWGYNGHGELGDGTTTTRYEPAPVSGPDGAVQLASGLYSHSRAVVQSGAVRCWGYNDQRPARRRHQDGRAPRRSPSAASRTPSPSRPGATTRARGSRGRHGQVLGLQLERPARRHDTRATNQRTTPVAVAGLSGVARPRQPATTHTCALLTNGEARCWGNNQNGQFGNGTTLGQLPGLGGRDPERCRPHGAGAPARRRRARTSATPARRSRDGTARCWGYNASGNVGDGSATARTLPVPVTGLARRRPGRGVLHPHRARCSRSGAARAGARQLERPARRRHHDAAHGAGRGHGRRHRGHGGAGPQRTPAPCSPTTR